MTISCVSASRRNRDRSSLSSDSGTFFIRGWRTVRAMMLVLIHVFLNNARYHHAKMVREWLARPGCRITLHFIPPYCPHLNPIERL
ncbi:MAG: hypothetical protein DLM68_07105 [Hyphomicrobiales bacterium]|nr:MAG: hypothetical protein DLM68_07105 [Hyphomicrobiales bacterium]